MDDKTTRRMFLKRTGAGAAALTLAGTGPAGAVKREYDISLAAYSLHRTIGKGAEKTPMLELPKLARDEFGIGAVELVNWMLASSDKAYLDAFTKNAAANNVTILLIMVDSEGTIGSPDLDDREDAIKRHSKWVDIAADMGCHSIRMNWAGAPRRGLTDAAELDTFIEHSAPAFGKLCDYADKKNINVIIENHGGPSSDPAAMERLMKRVDHERFGTLPDFGNFPRDKKGKHTLDIYDAIDRLMKYAKAVSAKCYDFDAQTGLETTLDFPRIIETVVDKHNYHGYIGIEYEGNRMSEFDGIKACKELLDKLRG